MCFVFLVDSGSSSDSDSEKSKQPAKKVFVNPLFKKKLEMKTEIKQEVKDPDDVKAALMEKLSNLISTEDSKADVKTEDGKADAKPEVKAEAKKEPERKRERDSVDSESKPKGARFDAVRLMQNSHRLKPFMDLLKVECGEGTLNFLGKGITMGELESHVNKALKQLESGESKRTRLGHYAHRKPSSDDMRKYKLRHLTIKVSDVGRSKFPALVRAHKEAKDRWNTYKRRYARKRREVLREGIKDVKRKLDDKHGRDRDRHHHGDGSRPPSKHNDDKGGGFKIPKKGDSSNTRFVFYYL